MTAADHLSAYRNLREDNKLSRDVLGAIEEPAADLTRKPNPRPKNERCRRKRERSGAPPG